MKNWKLLNLTDNLPINFHLIWISNETEHVFKIKLLFFAQFVIIHGNLNQKSLKKGC